MSSDCELPQQIRKNFFQSINNEIERFHENDIDRIRTSDNWLLRCYEHNANNTDKAVKMLIEMCEWRKSFGVYDLNETTLSKELLDLGQIFARNRDIDGCTLIIFRSYLHKSSNTDGLKKILVYWLEKIDREDHGKAVSLFFDQQNSGLSNFDLDFLMKFIFPLFDFYYPCFLNNIYIYELPWILSGALKMVKNLLPERFKKTLITISKSNINEYINKENCLKSWNNGLDNYKYEFVFDKTLVNNNEYEAIERKVFFSNK